ncbi:hypothetical protein Ddye_021637, partial [Dipteronia dyeriana]
MFTVTVDNASAIKVAIDYVKIKMKNWNESKLVLGGIFLHVRCCAHMINLIVSEGRKDMKDLHPRDFKNFRNCIEHERIESQSIVVLDVPTRWNSAHLTLPTALNFKKHLI